jgi:hypothetical protein
VEFDSWKLQAKAKNTKTERQQAVRAVSLKPLGRLDVDESGKEFQRAVKKLIPIKKP